MTEQGQTDNYSVSDHLNAIISHCGQGIVDYCIYDTGEIIPEFIKKYNMEGQDIVEQDIEKTKGIKFLQRDLSMISDGYIRHDPNLVAKSIIELICDDLKYQDKQNDPQYLMLNNKLKEDKRISKMKKQTKKENMKKLNSKKSASNIKRKSKFSNKYSERIASIREADEKTKRKNASNKIKEKSSKSSIQAKNKIEKQSTAKTKPKTTPINANESSKKVNTTNKAGTATQKRKKTPQEIREEMLRKLEGK